MLDEYEHFWVNEFSGENEQQLVVDWDSFIGSFGRVVAGQGNYTLNAMQKDYLRTQIDPQNAGYIHKNAFLLFCREYWDIPSNRNNLLKMKMNLTQALPRLTLLTTTPTNSLLITLRTPNRPRKRYELHPDALHQLDQQGFTAQEYPLRQKGFLRVGSDQRCEIIVDGLTVNPQHLKIIALSKEKPRPKKSLYAIQESDEPEKIQHENQWYVRDVARSNRTRLTLDNPQKYVVVKPGMVIGFGLTEQYQLSVNGIGPHTGDLHVDEQQVSQVEGLLNADRINFLGEIDPSVPIKSVVGLDYRLITAKQIDQLYQEGVYYPAPPTLSKPAKKKELPTLRFSIRNLTTGWSKDYLMDGAFSVGRAGCTVNLDEFSLRPRQLSFSLMNGIWLVRNADPLPTFEWQLGIPGVYLAAETAIKNRKSSNRLKLKAGKQYVLQGRQYELKLEVREPPTDSESQY